MRPIKFEIMFWINDADFTTSIAKHYTTIERITSGQDNFDYDDANIVARRQFTGLTDKNGVEIYEDDIIKTYHFTNRETKKDEYLYHVIRWSEKFHGWFMLNCGSMDENDGSIQLFVHLRANSDFEVISNIYQSPELLEKSND